MDLLQKFTRQVQSRLLGLLLLNNLVIVADWWLADEVFKLAGWWLVLVLVIVPILSLSILPWISTHYLTQPTRLVWQAILHLAPDAANVPPPDLEHAGLGRELVANLVNHVYQLANVTKSLERTAAEESSNLSSEFVATALPLPLIVLDGSDKIVFANQTAASYVGTTINDMLQQSVYSVLDMSFGNEQTFDRWLADAKANKAVGAQTWERVRLNLSATNKTLQFDLAAYYNKNNPHGFETMLVLFDHTKQYSQDDQAMSFVALAVHELRTPLTLLRGYIETFDDELGSQLNGEMQDFMRKMDAAAQQLAAFVNNILNVARIEDDQLTLQLREEKWPELLTNAIDNLRLRAGVRGIGIKLEIADNLPSVGVDSVSIYEVVSNLIDNAIKYSGNSKQIIVKSYLGRDGLVTTTVQDFGVGIADNIMSHLFEKFYRDHHNRSQIGGTGLGLYLSKAIVNAHGGQIWVHSAVGQGSTFGFSILPYSQLAAGQKNSNNNDIVRSAHGWIKNHSLYRR